MDEGRASLFLVSLFALFLTVIWPNSKIYLDNQGESQTKECSI